MDPFFVLDWRRDLPEAELRRDPPRFLGELEEAAGGREEQPALRGVIGVGVAPSQLLKVRPREELMAEALCLSPERRIALRSERGGVEALGPTALSADLITDELSASREEALVKLGEGLLPDRRREEELDEAPLLQLYLNARSPSAHAVSRAAELLSPSGLTSGATERLSLALLKFSRELLLVELALSGGEEFSPLKLSAQDEERLVSPQKMFSLDPEQEREKGRVTVWRCAHPEARHGALGPRSGGGVGGLIGGAPVTGGGAPEEERYGEERIYFSFNGQLCRTLLLIISGSGLSPSLIT